MMTDALDLLHCPSCGAFYKPVMSATGRTIPHCRLTSDLSLAQIMEANALAEGWRPQEGEWRTKGLDFTAIEQRVVDNLRLTDVVDPPLTVLSGRFKMFGLGFWEIILLIVLAAFLIWVDTTPAHGQCLMSYCKDKVSTRTYITNTHRQKVGDLYSVPGQRTQIRDRSRRIIGYIEHDGTITNTHRQKKGQLHE